MNTLDKQYTDLLQDILDNGVTKQDRTGTGTISVFGRQIRHKMSEGFPLLTTKKIAFKTMVTELLWFLKGDTNIKYLVDNDCHIWDGDCYQAYLKEHSKNPNETAGLNDGIPFNKSEFIAMIQSSNAFANRWGDLGPIYGKQWRSWKFTDKFTNGEQIAYVNGKIDQIANLINDLKTNPDSRRLMVNSWNVGELDQMTLPPCHYGFQVYTRELSQSERTFWIMSNRPEQLGSQNYLDGDRKGVKLTDYDGAPTRAISLMWNQRSCDLFLGIPFNIASYGLLLEIIAKVVNMVPDELIGNLGDTHLYSNHIEQSREQIGRELNLDERAGLHPTPEVFYEINGIYSIDKSIEESSLPGDDREWLHQKFDEGGIPKRTREPFPLPTLKHMKTDAFYKSLSEEQSLYGHLDPKDFQLENYQSHPSIKAPLSN